MLEINSQLSIPDEEIEMIAIRAQGSGGQNVNKVASAVHLRFDLLASSLPESVKARLMCIPDRRISKSGVIVIKAQEHRTFEKNREAARQRLTALIRKATTKLKKRRPTRPSRGSVRRRLDSKTRRGKVKALRRKVTQ
ncbi:peptidyl-tRNA hydrolase [Desulfosarcina widdelii]|uniref:Peptidyl-tRNA hydrolase n=1 Tax=Desulfosarcina widdelii TaxID=947919 RepID=A0A5K7ZP74_9BACT|nr:alternative ribosome rescue aminoacyl-tRNA hydrolase ArfB [Desulfosarcina widdelii]BBO78217.1 peptidyl-tRNA hydrolase [Desulfosarcina widdelii]